MSTTVKFDDVSQLDNVVEQVAAQFEAWETKVHVLWNIISQYMNKPSRDLDSAALREDIKYDLKSALEHDGLL